LGQEAVKVIIHSQDIEIPHLSLASSVAFPNEVFGFSYVYNQADKPISSVTIDLGDSSRRISVSGGSADKVEELSKLLEEDFRRYSTAAGGLKFRRVAGICLSMLFLSSLMISAAYCWNNRNSRVALGMPICSGIGFLLLLFVPWNRFLPGFVLYQRYSPFFLVRHAPEIFFLAVVAALDGIPLSHFLSRHKRQHMSDPVQKQIQQLIDRETLGLSSKNPDLFVDFIHPDMVWPWPPTPRDHDPIRWKFVLGRFQRDRWRQYFQAIFDQYDLVHNDRRTVKI